MRIPRKQLGGFTIRGGTEPRRKMVLRDRHKRMLWYSAVMAASTYMLFVHMWIVCGFISALCLVGLWEEVN